MNNKDAMHPEDLRNLIIFAVLSLCIWFFYETYVLKPKEDALKNARKARAELLLKNPEVMEFKPVAREEALVSTRDQRLVFDNGQIKGSISLKGGQFDDLTLAEYYTTLEKKENVDLLSPTSTDRSRYMNYGWVAGDKSLALPDENTQWQVRGEAKLSKGGKTVLYWDNGQGLVFEREISLDDHFVFQIVQRVRNNTGKHVSLHPYALISQTGVPHDNHNTWVMHEGPVGYFDGLLVQTAFQTMASSEMPPTAAKTGWIGVSDKYWLTALIPSQGQESKFRFKYVPSPLKHDLNRYQTDFTGAAVEIAPGQAEESSYHFYAGAKKVLLLEEYEQKLGVRNLNLAVDFGWFWFFTYPFFLALHYLGLWVGNMGVAIIIMTIIIRGAVFPLTNFSYRSFAKMKVVAPRIAELREQYGDDKEKLQASIVELYQKEGVNPMSGCLPILIQIPIFFAFYKMIFITIEIRQAPFFGWIQDLSAKDPTSVFNLFGLLPYDVPSFLTVGVWPCLMMICMLIQKQLNPPPQDKMQRDMMRFFPFFITFVMAGFASGLVIYWTLSALIGIIQQMIIMRSMGVPIYLFEKDKFAEQAEKQLDQGPSVHPLIEMAENEVEGALFGSSSDDTTPPDVTPLKPKKKKKK